MLRAGLLLASIASTAASVSAQPAASNASAQSILVADNSSLEATRGWDCRPPRMDDACWRWFMYAQNNGPYSYCTLPGDSKSWTMLYAYRAGGTEGVHWKYTDHVNEAGCMINWNYYAEDGTTLITRVYASSTDVGSSRGWCALPVYRSGGVEGYQWAYCNCKKT